MLTIEDFIQKKKKEDKINEFDISKHSENLSAIIKFVMEYFNSYLDMETIDDERAKTEQVLSKLEKEVQPKFSNSYSFILDFYRQYHLRIHKLLESYMSKYPYVKLFYSDSDFCAAVDAFCENFEYKTVSIEEYKSLLLVLAKEIKDYITPRLSFENDSFIGSSLRHWVYETYKTYEVNLYDFASDIASSYFDKYVKYVGNSRYINQYDHRYNEHVFEIDKIYDENMDRPFIEARKTELEMLIMYFWIDLVNDQEYWPEYVNLCISTGRTQFVKNMNVLLPVRVGNVKYPDDVTTSLECIEFQDGAAKHAPGGPYILKVTLHDDDIWKNENDMQSFVAALNITIKSYGVPQLIEFTSPIISSSLKQDTFWDAIEAFQKSIKKYPKMKFAIVNGSNPKKQANMYLFGKVDDLKELRRAAKERDVRLTYSINFVDLIPLNARYYSDEYKALFDELHQHKHVVSCIHLAGYKNPTGTNEREFDSDGDIETCNAHYYTTSGGIYKLLGQTFNDSQPRYLVPHNIKSDSALVEIVDNLLMSGFSFASEPKR